MQFEQMSGSSFTTDIDLLFNSLLNSFSCASVKTVYHLQKNEMCPALKNNGGASCQGPMKIQVLKGSRSTVHDSLTE